jgi:surface protein
MTKLYFTKLDFMKNLLLLSLLVLFGCEKDPVQYNLSVVSNPQEGGLVNPSRGLYDAGETVSIVTVPNDIFIFKGWSGDWTGNDLQFTITMDSDKNIIANYEDTDIDRDGILNVSDSCPGTVNGSSVNGSGCALSQRDSDNDGLNDEIDACPNGPIGPIMGSNGCKVDLFYMDSNGYTIKAIPEAEPGMEDIFQGDTWEVIDEQTLRDYVEIWKTEFSYYALNILNNVVTSKVTDMSFLFEDYSNPGGLFRWDVSNVTDMSYMFKNGAVSAEALREWDVSNVENFEGMFMGTKQRTINAEPRILEIGDWNTSSATNMKSMFHQPSGEVGFYANPDFIRLNVDNWDVSNVTDMSSIFYNVTNFNVDISGWDVSSVTDMAMMFRETPFNQDISSWDVSNLINMNQIFADSNFNQPIGDWDVSNVLYMYDVFINTPFNQPIGNWNVGKVTNMQGMFFGTPFNQDISSWDVSNVQIMSYMFFQNFSFNQDISSWDVSSVVYMNWMFHQSLSFNQNISFWDVSNVLSCPSFDFNSNSVWSSSYKPNFTNCNPAPG